MLRNPRLRRRLYLRLVAVPVTIVAIIVTLAALLRTSTIREQIRAFQIITHSPLEEPKQPAQTRPTNGTGKPTPAAVASQMLGAEANSAAAPMIASARLTLMHGLLDRPPWFDPGTLTEVRKTLNLMRESGLTDPSADALDPDKHSPDELRSTVCAFLKTPRFLEALQASSHEAPTAPRYVTFAADPDETRALLAACVQCEVCDDNAETAVARFLEAFRIPRTPGRPDSDRLWATRLLPGLLDTFPGAVPPEVAKQLLQIVDPPVDLEPEKRRIRLRQASLAQGVFDSRLRATQTAFFMNLSLHEGLRKLNEPNLAQGLLDATERALRLLDTPPYQASAEFDKIQNNIQRTAQITAGAVDEIRSLCDAHHCAIAMAALAHTAIALKQYKSEHGAYPDSLDAVTPPPPTDPYSGQPMLYKRDAEGFSILSQSEAEPRRVVPPSWTARR